MQSQSAAQEMTQEERLKAIAYQFLKLYERWSEDRQVAAKQGADTAELVKLFTEQVQGFKELEPKVRRHIAITITDAADAAGQKISEKIEEAATRQMDASSQRLQVAVTSSIDRLKTYEIERRRDKTLYYYIAGLFLLAILVGFSVGRYAVPQPYLPLTGDDLNTYAGGQFLNKFWPKLSKAEQMRLRKLATTPTQEVTPSNDDS